MRFPTNSKLGAENPKAADEATRETEQHQLHKLTAYDRYIQYGKLPRKKNARKRVGRRLLRQAEKITPEERVKRVNEVG